MEDKAKDCLAAFNKAMAENKELSIEALIGVASKLPAPRFYCTFENARRFVSLLDRGKPLPLKQENKIAMYEEIFRRYKLLAGDSGKRYKYTVLENIIKEPAPSFYLDFETFRALVYKAMKKR